MQRRGLLPAFSAPYIKVLVPGVWSKGLEKTERETEVVPASEWWRGGGGGDGKVVRIGDARYTRLSRLRLRIPCVGECFHKR